MKTNNTEAGCQGVLWVFIFLPLFILLSQLCHIMLKPVFKYESIKSELSKERTNLETDSYWHMWFPVIVQLSTNKNEFQSELLILRLDPVGGFSSVARNQITFNKTNQIITIDDIKPYLENVKYDNTVLSFLIPVWNQDDIKNQIARDHPRSSIDLSVKEYKDGSQSIDLRLEGQRIERGWYIATKDKIFPKYYLHSSPVYDLHSLAIGHLLGFILSFVACRLLYKKTANLGFSNPPINPVHPV